MLLPAIVKVRWVLLLLPLALVFQLSSATFLSDSSENPQTKDDIIQVFAHTGYQVILKCSISLNDTGTSHVFNDDLSSGNFNWCRKSDFRSFNEGERYPMIDGNSTSSNLEKEGIAVQQSDMCFKSISVNDSGIYRCIQSDDGCEKPSPTINNQIKLNVEKASPNIIVAETDSTLTKMKVCWNLKKSPKVETTYQLRYTFNHDFFETILASDIPCFTVDVSYSYTLPYYSVKFVALTENYTLVSNVIPELHPIKKVKTGPPSNLRYTINGDTHQINICWEKPTKSSALLKFIYKVKIYDVRGDEVDNAKPATIFSNKTTCYSPRIRKLGNYLAVVSAKPYLYEEHSKYLTEDPTSNITLEIQPPPPEKMFQFEKTTVSTRHNDDEYTVMLRWKSYPEPEHIDFDSFYYLITAPNFEQQLNIYTNCLAFNASQGRVMVTGKNCDQYGCGKEVQQNITIPQDKSVDALKFLLNDNQSGDVKWISKTTIGSNQNKECRIYLNRVFNNTKETYDSKQCHAEIKSHATVPCDSMQYTIPSGNFTPCASYHVTLETRVEMQSQEVIYVSESDPLQFPCEDISPSSLIVPAVIAIPLVLIVFITVLSMRRCCKKLLRKVKQRIWPPVPKPTVLVRFSDIAASLNSVPNNEEEFTMLFRRRPTEEDGSDCGLMSISLEDSPSELNFNDCLEIRDQFGDENGSPDVQQNTDSTQNHWPAFVETTYIEEQPLIQEDENVFFTESCHKQDHAALKLPWKGSSSIAKQCLSKTKHTGGRLRKASSCSLIGTETTYLQSYVRYCQGRYSEQSGVCNHTHADHVFPTSDGFSCVAPPESLVGNLITFSEDGYRMPLRRSRSLYEKGVSIDQQSHCEETSRTRVMTQPVAVATDDYLPDPLQPNNSLWGHQHHHSEIEGNDSFFIPIPASHRRTSSYDGYTEDSRHISSHADVIPNDTGIIAPPTPGMKPYVLFDKDILKSLQSSSVIPANNENTKPVMCLPIPSFIRENTPKTLNPSLLREANQNDGCTPDSLWSADLPGSVIPTPVIHQQKEYVTFDDVFNGNTGLMKAASSQEEDTTRSTRTSAKGDCLQKSLGTGTSHNHPHPYPQLASECLVASNQIDNSYITESDAMLMKP